MWESIGNGSKVSSVGVRLRKMQTSFPQQCLWWQKNQGPEFFSWLWPSVGRLVGLPDSSAGKESTCNAGDRREKEKRVQSLGQEDPLREEMATHSIILAWKIPWTEEPGGLQSKGSQRIRHDWETEHTCREVSMSQCLSRDSFFICKRLELCTFPVTFSAKALGLLLL